MEKCNLIVTDAGDSSVGIYPQSWTVECPFTEKQAREDKEMADWFLEQMKEAYKEFCDGRCSADYEFIMKENFND